MIASRSTALAISALLGACLARSSYAAEPTAAYCASSSGPKVSEFYEKRRPGVPLSVASRTLLLPELTVAASLPSSLATVAAADSALTKRVWESIDTWGNNTLVKLVLSSSNQHTFAFPSKVPIRQPDDGSGLMDVYADGGAGVHAHIKLDHVFAVAAVSLPGKTSDTRTEAVTFYNADGSLILGVYARIANQTFDRAALEGFARTQKLIQANASLCSRNR
jgi:putative heme iron utilization protein